MLRTQDGETDTVEDVQTEQLDEPVRVYNLEIEVSHTYYVSADGVLVHNGCSKNSDGTYNIDDWSNYPDGLVHPDGPFNILEGDEYTAARKDANKVNARLHSLYEHLRGL